MENAKIARYAYNFISRIGDIKDLLLIFQACSCLAILVVNPSHVITCRHNSFQDVVYSKHELNIQDQNFKFSREMNENLCTYKHSDTFFNRFLFLVIGLTVIGFIQVKSRITTNFLKNRISTVQLLNIVLTAYALIGLSKYFIFPQLNSILYGYSSIFQLLLSPIKLILTCILVIVGFPLSLFYRYTRSHLFEIPKSIFVDLVFSSESDSYRSAFEAVPDEMLSIDCGNACVSVFKWSNLYLLTLHIIACALLINKDSTNDSQCSPKGETSCKTCHNSKNLSFLPYHDEANKNDLRNKFATKPVNVTKPLNVSPTLCKKKIKVESSTQTVDVSPKTSRRNSSVKRRIQQLEGSMSTTSSTIATQTSTALPAMSTAVSTQTHVELSTKSNQTTDDTLEILNIDKVTQTIDCKPEIKTSDRITQTVTPKMRPINKLVQTDSIPKPKSSNKSIQLNQTDLKLFKTCGTSTDKSSCKNFSTQTDIIKNNNEIINGNKKVCDNELLVKNSKIVDSEKELFIESKQNEVNIAVTSDIDKTFNDTSMQTMDKTFVSTSTSVDIEAIEKFVQTTLENSEKYVQTNKIVKDTTEKSIQASRIIPSRQKSVQTPAICQEEMSVQTEEVQTTIENSEKYVQTNKIVKDTMEKSIQASRIIPSRQKSVQTPALCQEEISVQTDEVFILSIEEGEEYIRSASSELISLNVSEESLTTETYEMTVSIDDLEEGISVLCIDSVSEVNEEQISVRSLESGFVDESDDSYILEEPQKLVSDENEDCYLEESSKVTIEERTCQTISVMPLNEGLPQIETFEPTTMDQSIQISSKCHCNKDINRMNKRTQTSVNSLEKSVQVYSLRNETRKDRSDSKPLATFDEEILYSSRDSLYFDCEDRDTNSLRRKSLISIGTNTEDSQLSDQSIQTNEKREVRVSYNNMDFEYQHVTVVDSKELKELEYKEIENICKIWDNKKTHRQQLNKSTQIDFIEVRESLNDLNSCSCKKENIGKTVYSMMALDEHMFNLCEPIKFKAKKSCHGVWYACLRGDVFLTVSQEVLSNIHLLSEVENIERFVDDYILDTMKAFIANYSRLSVYFDDDLEESDDESFINGFRL